LLKKRKYQLIAFFAILIAVIPLLLYYNAYQLKTQSDEAISYSFSNAKNNLFLNFTGGSNDIGAINSIPINGYNSGKKDENFSIVVSFVNATISASTNQGCIVNNSTSAEFMMFLHPGGSDTNQAYYNIDSNVASYSVKLSVHGNQGYLKANPVYPTYVVFSYSKLFPNFFPLQSADGHSSGFIS
jgi:hypothetical protein